MERTIKRAHLSGELERNRRSYEIYMLYTLQGMKVSEIAKKYGIKISITESGDPKDNAVAERVNNTIKNELHSSV